MNILLSFLPSLVIGGALVAVSRARAEHVEFAAGISRLEALSYDIGFRAGIATCNQANIERAAKRTPDPQHFSIEEYFAALNYGAPPEGYLHLYADGTFRLGGVLKSAPAPAEAAE